MRRDCCTETGTVRLGSAIAVILWVLVPTGLVGPQEAQAYDPLVGDFSKADPLDVRIVAYNHNRSFIENSGKDAAFDRILIALNPDIICFEEFTSAIAPNDVANRLNSILPTGGAGWQIHFGLLGGIRTVLASRYPLLMTRTDTIPAASTRGVTLALADLPDVDYPVDVYLLGVHLKCCGSPGGSEDAKRQASADAMANWMGDARGVARPSGENIALPTDTPMIALGDFNLVGGPQPETTILTGNIQDTGTYGPAVKGDWDGSNLTNLNPLDPFTGDNFTWQGSGSFNPSPLDRMFFTDSVMTVANSFVLNTDTMTATALTNAGLQAGDTLPSNTSDHLPIVLDMRLSAAGCMINADCDDGLVCNGTETCVGGRCVAGNDLCPGQNCEEATQTCAECFINAQCDDGLFCTGVETCVGQVCQPGTDPCGGLPCNEFTGTCGGGGVGTDPWINELHYDNSGSDTGEFVEIAGPAGLDLNGWQVVGYNGNNGSSYNTITLSGTIPDQAGCTGTLAFNFSSMQNGAPDGLALVDPSNTAIEFLSYEGVMTAGNGPASGMTSVDIGVAESGSTPVGFSLQLAGTGAQPSAFVWQPASQNTSGQPNTGQVLDGCGGCTTNAECDDGLFCNGAETCVASVCQPGVAVNCDDGVGCTMDSCNEATNQCDNVANNAVCDNGLFCDGSETCDPAMDCQPGIAVNCDDGVGCTVDSCNNTTSQCDNLPNDAICDNGLFCDGAETCDPVNDCQPGTAVNCDDGVGCTVDTCNDTTDQCDNLPDDAVCDNGLFCDGVETCDPVNDCQPGTAVNCDDGVGCTVDTCNDTTDQCDNLPDDAVCDNGLFCDGVETCDPVNDCQPGTAVNCDDGVGCTVDTCNDTTDQCDN
ncbi:MAG: endonuclease/exonuclease/phosphatase family protein, partial [Phycisphaerae bacterium]